MTTDAVPDFEAGTITRTVEVRASLEATWAALTDPEAIGQWWGHLAVFPDGMREGSAGTFEWVDHGLMPMRIERFEAPTRFDLLWGHLGDETPGPDASLVEFSLVADGPERTLLTVVETGFTDPDRAARRAAMEENVTGWTLVLDSFVRHVEASA